MAQQWARLLGGLILAWPLAAAASPPDLPLAVDLKAEATRANRAGAPLVVLFSRKDCPYCETIRRNYLKPLAADPRFHNRLVVRQVNQDGLQPLTGFQGQAVSHASFAEAEQIKLVPVVAFYGADGRRLAEPIVGTRLPDFYLGYLEGAIEQSARILRSQ